MLAAEMRASEVERQVQRQVRGFEAEKDNATEEQQSL